MYKIRIEPFGALVHHRNSCTTYEFTRDEARRFYPGPFPSHPKGIMAPRIVHLELTSRCNMDPLCEYCYAHPNIDMSSIGELETDEWTQVLDKLSDSGVLQVTFGGGEPTLREDLLDLANYCKDEAKMNVGMTTNGVDFPVQLWHIFDQINFSLHQDTSRVMPPLLAMLHAYPEIKVGVNIICSKDNLFYIQLLKEFFSIDQKYKDKIEVLLLSYKPIKVKHIPDMLPRSKVMEIAHDFNDSGIRVGVDGYTCGTCEGGFTFCDISSTGEVYPCSFVRESYGNILQEPFNKIWARMPRIERCPYGTSTK